MAAQATRVKVLHVPMEVRVYTHVYFHVMQLVTVSSQVSQAHPVKMVSNFHYRVIKTLKIVKSFYSSL